VSQPWFLTGDPREKTPLITSVFRYHGGLTFAALADPIVYCVINHGGLTFAAPGCAFASGRTMFDFPGTAVGLPTTAG
jgi:hypothetical protein